MTWKECKNLIYMDLQRFSGGGGQNKCPGQLKTSLKASLVIKLLTSDIFQFLFCFRIGSYFRSRKFILWKLPLAIMSFIQFVNKERTGIQINFGTEIGGGFFIGHCGCIVINGSAVIGSGCTIMQGVTIGSVRGPKGGVPTIGNNVFIGSGAQVIGNVTVGDNVMIGAGAVVVKSIPSGGVAAGNPAKVISMDGEKNVGYYLNNR